VKLIVDTSVLIPALIKNTIVRELLLNPLFEFYVSEYCIEEVERHLNEISKRSGLSVENIYVLLGILLASVQVVPAERIFERIMDAEKIILTLRPNDAQQLKTLMPRTMLILITNWINLSPHQFRKVSGQPNLHSSVFEKMSISSPNTIVCKRQRQCDE